MSEGRGGGIDTAADPAGAQASDPSPVIVVMADDLIWSTRLVDALRRAGATPRPARSLADLDARLADADGCLVDLTSRTYEGIDAVAAAVRAGVPMIAVGQHDDAALRRAAKDAGAARVFSYRRLFEHGDRDLATWVRSLVPAADGTRPAADGASSRGRA